MLYFRDAGDGLYVFDFTTNMDIRFLNQQLPIPYKYVVYSMSKHYEEVNHPYEYLHGAAYASHNPNRCLVIPSNKIASKSEPHLLFNK